MADTAGKEQLNWTVEQTFGLIKFWTENEEKFTQKKFASKLLWEKAVKDLGLEGRITGEKAGKKWENLKKRYKDLKTPKTGSGTENGEKTVSNWRYFEAMHAVLGGRPAIDPPVIVASFKPAEDPTVLLMAIVAPEHEALEEDISEPVPTLHPTTPVRPTTPTTTFPTTPATTRPPTTPATPSSCKRKRGNNLILDFLQAESVKEQERHKETEAQTERFLTLFERLVDKMPQQ
ncbi:hypothetical protein R3I94_015411 [Phoxinus phoxinus]